MIYLSIYDSDLCIYHITKSGCTILTWLESSFLPVSFVLFTMHEELSFDHIFTSESYAFVIVHAEADYFTPLKAGDEIEIELFVEKIGNTSFTIAYKIYKSDKTLAGSAKTVHVTVNRETRKKIPIPEKLITSLEKYGLVRAG